MKKENIFVMENGDSIELFDHEIKRGIHFSAEPVYIDGNDIGGLSSAVIKDREILKQDGLIAVIVGINSKTGEIIVPPNVITKAFSNDDETLVSDIEQLTTKILEKLMAEKTTFNEIKTNIKELISRFVSRRTERSPMIVPVVMDQK